MAKRPLSFDHFRDVALCLFDWYIVLSQPQSHWCKLPVTDTGNTAQLWKDVFAPSWFALERGVGSRSFRQCRRWWTGTAGAVAITGPAGTSIMTDMTTRPIVAGSLLI